MQYTLEFSFRESYDNAGIMDAVYAKWLWLYIPGL